MADYREYIDAEYEAIEKTLSSLPAKPLSELSQLISGASKVFKNFKTEIDKTLV